MLTVVREKQCKNKIKAWGWSKYLKGDKARQLIDGTLPADNPQEVEKAARSLKRKRNRDKQQEVFADLYQDESIPPVSAPVLELLPTSQHNHQPQTDGPLIRQPQRQRSIPESFQHGTVLEKFLYSLTKYAHEAFLNGHWDVGQTKHHFKGRQAARSFSSDLSTGRTLYEKGKTDKSKAVLARNHWQSALNSLQNPDLINTWYNETPIRLLFEVARMVLKGHVDIAKALLEHIKNAAHKHLTEDDPRYALFTSLSNLSPELLRDVTVYAQAALRFSNSVESCTPDNNPQPMYEMKLNRALDLLGLDGKADVMNYLPAISKVDRDLGPDNAYSVYFLLLEAHRKVVIEQYEAAENICNEAGRRLNTVTGVQDKVDPWRVGKAYQRLGREYRSKKQYKEARQKLLMALKYLRKSPEVKSVLIEIYQHQESMAQEMGDELEAMLYTETLQALVQKSQQKSDNEAVRPPENEQAAFKRRRCGPTLATQPPFISRESTGWETVVEVSPSMDNAVFASPSGLNDQNIESHFANLDSATNIMPTNEHYFVPDPNTVNPHAFTNGGTTFAPHPNMQDAAAPNAFSDAGTADLSPETTIPGPQMFAGPYPDFGMGFPHMGEMFQSGFQWPLVNFEEATMPNGGMQFPLPTRPSPRRPTS